MDRPATIEIDPAKRGASQTVKLQLSYDNLERASLETKGRWSLKIRPAGRLICRTRFLIRCGV
jgi:hypothetical protein